MRHRTAVGAIVQSDGTEGEPNKQETQSNIPSVINSAQHAGNTVLHCCAAQKSEVHTFTDTFSKESGVSIANAMRMTCDFAYDIGRKR